MMMRGTTASSSSSPAAAAVTCKSGVSAGHHYHYDGVDFHLDMVHICELIVISLLHHFCFKCNIWERMSLCA